MEKNGLFGTAPQQSQRTLLSSTLPLQSNPISFFMSKLYQARALSCCHFNISRGEQPEHKVRSIVPIFEQPLSQGNRSLRTWLLDCGRLMASSYASGYVVHVSTFQMIKSEHQYAQFSPITSTQDLGRLNLIVSFISANLVSENKRLGYKEKATPILNFIMSKGQVRFFRYLLFSY